MALSPDAADLADQILLIAASLELRLYGQLGHADEEAAARVATVMASARARIDARAESGLAAAQLTSAFGLSEMEQNVIWLLAAVAMRREVRMLLGRCTGEPTPDPTLDAIASVIYGDEQAFTALQELGPLGRLRGLGLIERSDGDDESVHESRRTWALARRVLGFLGGDRELAPELEAVRGQPVRDIATCFEDATHDAARDAVVEGRRLVVATGLPGSGRRTLLVAAARTAGLLALDVDVRRLATHEPTFRKQVRAILREARLLGRVLLFANIDAIGGESDRRLDVLGDAIATSVPGLVLATCGIQRRKIDWRRPVISVEVSSPSTALRARLWRTLLGAAREQEAERLATCYPLAPGLVIEAAEAAHARAEGATPSTTDVRAGIRSVLDDRLGSYARRITVTQTWDDVVLPREQINQLVELLARVRQRAVVYEQWGFAAKVGRGLGTTALFAGPPGTGKTMVAGLIAQDLGIDLYQVDMAKVVSKYIGETEQHLAALFDAAEAGHAILLFDEADALFGKRTEVKSSNDRFANLETNYLLQRLESFSGICLLTSNHDSHIDPAFQRRLSLHLRFELPEADERARIWRAALPTCAPVATDVDFNALGERYSMSGGYIRNAALRAAFLAAEERSTISARHLEYAARAEYESMGKIVPYIAAA